MVSRRRMGSPVLERPLQGTIRLLPFPPGILDGNAAPALGQVNRYIELADGTSVSPSAPMAGLRIVQRMVL
jgi:hypothetical protein